MNITLTIPFFGFYESQLSQALDFEEEQLAEYLAERDDTFKGYSALDIGEELYWAMNYGTAHHALAKEYAEQFAHELNDNLPSDCAPFALTFETMDSPKEYNFTTDRCYMTMPLADLQRMRDEVAPGTLGDTIRERFTSRSGFHSFYSNVLADWDAKPLAEWDHNEAGTLLVAYLADHYDNHREGIEHAVLDAMHEGNAFGDAADAALDRDELMSRLMKKAA